MRLSAVLLLLAALMACYAAFQPDNTLELYDNVKASVASTDVERHETHYRSNGRRRTRTYYTYTVTFSGTYSNGGDFRLTQRISESLYKTYSSIEGGLPVDMYLYRSDLENSYFISIKTRKDATKEFRSSNPSLGASASYAGIWYVLIGAFILIAIGSGEMRVSLKYPRSDVPLTDADLAVKKETDDLLAEFDAAYAKRQAQLKAGILPDDGMTPNLPDSSGSDRQLK